MAQLINCEFKIKIIISANRGSGEENIKTLKSVSIFHKIAACDTNLNNAE